MKTSVVLLVAVLGCTKPNPNRCCTDEADCAAHDIPVGSVCAEGLVCRGNQCIAQPCMGSAQCDAAAPYCVAELCAESCTDDAQCPGAAQDASYAYCIEGACVVCRESADCSADAPVCEQGACRGCVGHDECASQICDSGQCVAETRVAYAAPAGSTTSACTQQQPCTFQRALTVADPTRNVIKLLPGMYPPSTDISGYWWFRGAFELTVYGPATLQSALLNQMPGSGVQAMRLRDLATTSWIECTGNGGNTIPTLELDHVVIDNMDDAGSNLALIADLCKLHVRDSVVRALGPYANAIDLSGGGTAGQTAVIERSLIRVREGVLDAGSAFRIAYGASLEMTNSVVRGGRAISGAIAFGTNARPSSIRFSTFYNTFLNCPSEVLFESQNNIFLNETNGAPADTLQGQGCIHRYVMAKPQSSAINGTNNMSNIDPRFVDAANGDFHLVAGSPAIDNADAAATESADFEGTPRPQGVGRDIGAFEFN